MHPLFAILLLAAPIILSGGIALRIPVQQTRLRLFLAFSAAYLFAISIMHMLPEAFVESNVKQVGLFIVIGFCSQLVIDTFSTGIEHGHVHLHSSDCHTHLPPGIIVGLFLHSFLEGLPVYDLHASEAGNVNYQLILGLAIHNFPITIAFVALLREHESLVSKRIFLLVLFALMSPLGYLTSFALQSIGLSNYEMYGQLAYAMVIGIFLHISTAILFETSDQHRYNLKKVTVMLAGIVAAYFFS